MKRWAGLGGVLVAAACGTSAPPAQTPAARRALAPLLARPLVHRWDDGTAVAICAPTAAVRAGAKPYPLGHVRY